MAALLRASTRREGAVYGMVPEEAHTMHAPRADVSAGPRRFHRGRARLLALATLACVSYCIATVIALHALRPDVDPIQRAVSDYAVGRYGAAFTAALVVRAAAAVCLGFGLVQTLTVRTRLVVALLAIYALCGLLIAVFPADGPGVPHTFVGITHLLFAGGSFLAVTAAAFAAAHAFGRDPLWHPFQRAAYALAFLVLAGIATQVIAVILLPFTSLNGLAERIFIATEMTWLAAVAIRL